MTDFSRVFVSVALQVTSCLLSDVKCAGEESGGGEIQSLSGKFSSPRSGQIITKPLPLFAEIDIFSS